MFFKVESCCIGLIDLLSSTENLKINKNKIEKRKNKYEEQWIPINFCPSCGSSNPFLKKI